VDGDGRLDILTGSHWYRAPVWEPVLLRATPDYDPTTGYSDSFLNFTADVNGDGRADLIVIGFPGKAAYWLENPGPRGGEWPVHEICPSACNESPLLADVDGDGRDELVMAFDERRMAWFEPGPDPAAPWVVHPVGKDGDPGTARYAHGLGVGDLDGDGQVEILCRDGYWDCRGDPREDAWEFVPCDFGPDCAQMIVFDADGDGRAEVFTSSAHRKGLWWRRPLGDSPTDGYERRVIDESWSQSHALVLADLDGDGLPDLVTGKRVWAHGPTGDVEPNHPAVLYWYRLQRGACGPSWVRHHIDDDSGVGTQFVVCDVDGDGRPDVVTSNKRGVFLFSQA
jgi:hypothetical protein